MGDVVIEVNGENVEDKYLEDIIMLVKKGGQCLSLLVMDKTGYNKKHTEDGTDSEVTEYTAFRSLLSDIY